MTHGSARKLCALGSLLLLMLACSCSGSPESADSAIPAVTAADAPSFPNDEVHYSRQVNAVEAVNGQASFSNVGAPGFTAHPEASGVAILQSSVEVPTAWAIYRFPLNVEPTLEEIRINLFQRKLDDTYHVLIANYNTNRWQLLATRTASTAFFPADWNGIDITSPGKYCYIALIVLDNRDINVAGIEATIDSSGGNDDPIFDDFEDNDTLAECTPISTGSYHASTHDTYVPEMSAKGEGEDHWDFYCIELEAGKHFSATMKYEFVDHFNQPNGSFNDLDILVYEPGVLDLPLDTFHEQWSSYRIYFTNMELVHFVVPQTGTYRLGIRGDLGDQFTAESNSEYVLNTYVSDATYTVSGLITQNEMEVEEKFLVVLTPGNFSGVTSLEASPHGGYSIPGVPNGTYTLEVHGSAGFGQHDYVYPNTQQVVVNNGNVNISMSIDPFPG